MKQLYPPEIIQQLAFYYLLEPEFTVNTPQEDIDAYFMQLCLELSEIARKLDEVPVASIVVLDNRIVGIGINSSISTHDATAHAEILAIRDAGNRVQNYRLVNTTIYVSLEPCPMCSGAIMHARCKRIVYGALDYKTGALQSRFNLYQDFPMNHFPEITGQVLETQAQDNISSYFRAKRHAQKQAKQKIANLVSNMTNTDSNTSS